MKGRQQSSGVEVGTGVAVGAQTGWYVYAQAGFSNRKQDENHLTHQNSQIDTETLNINTQGNTTLKGAVAKAKTINADIKGNLTIESLQDIHQSESDSAGFGGRVQAARLGEAVLTAICQAVTQTPNKWWNSRVYLLKKAAITSRWIMWS